MLLSQQLCKPEVKPDVTAVSAPAPSSPAETTPAAANEAAGDVRTKWLNDPYPDIPNEVTDEDIAKMTSDSINKTFEFLKSPSMANVYKTCQEKEDARIGSKVAELKKAAGNATTTAERNTLQGQVAEIEKIKAKIAPTTCLLRTVRRATVELKLEYFGVQPKYGPQKANDEQFTVVQLFKVANRKNRSFFYLI